MFTVYHFIWLGICLLMLLAALLALRKYRPPLKKLLSLACVLCVLSELTKTLSVLELVPSADGGSLHLYLEMQHLPLHLCSIQILFIFYARFAKDGPKKETLLAFMYPTCTLGAFFALLLPTIFSTSIRVEQAFTHPLAYQFFLYHAMLILLGLYIALSGQVHIRPRHYLSTMGILAVLAFASIYANSIFAVPHYVDGQLVSVDYSTNFFFTQRTPIGIALTEKWQWFAYMGVIIALAALLIGLFYLPFFRRAARERHRIH